MSCLACGERVDIHMCEGPAPEWDCSVCGKTNCHEEIPVRDHCDHCDDSCPERERIVHAYFDAITLYFTGRLPAQKGAQQ